MIIMCNSRWFVHKPSSQSLTIIIILIIIMRTHTTPGGLCINHLNLHHSTFTADHSTVYSCLRHNHTYAIVIVILISTLHSSLVCIQLGHIMLVWYFAMSRACHEKYNQHSTFKANSDTGGGAECNVTHRPLRIFCCADIMYVKPWTFF